ncbi:hypothetical protein JM93_00905 [Roseibium hamelinense]|uniref:Uncharacterized protein n=1 Tax=Roseibium hamelinense TaxID=150831 RepID=A0A562TI24_9HYPH|nr:hypothetical protein [Roseibium hamelinense]MTI42604.1 hypothetical protein [Roseibium hamelinense]TWI93349.1 hypothetical protein JM93_00905 [Roseibium hamelinense]
MSNTRFTTNFCGSGGLNYDKSRNNRARAEVIRKRDNNLDLPSNVSGHISTFMNSLNQSKAKGTCKSFKTGFNATNSLLRNEKLFLSTICNGTSTNLDINNAVARLNTDYYLNNALSHNQITRFEGSLKNSLKDAHIPPAAQDHLVRRSFDPINGVPDCVIESIIENPHTEMSTLETARRHPNQNIQTLANAVIAQRTSLTCTIL